MGLEDGSDPLKMDHHPHISIDGEVTWIFNKTARDQSKDQGSGLSSEEAKTKDTIKMDEPTAQQAKCRLKLQQPFEPRKETSFLDETDTEITHSFGCTKQETARPDQGDNLVLEEGFVQQTTIGFVKQTTLFGVERQRGPAATSISAD